MPYTEAFIMEVQRRSHLTPVGVGHTATEDVEFGGYQFPKVIPWRTMPTIEATRPER